MTVIDGNVIYFMYICNFVDPWQNYVQHNRID